MFSIFRWIWIVTWRDRVFTCSYIESIFSFKITCLHSNEKNSESGSINSWFMVDTLPHIRQFTSVIFFDILLKIIVFLFFKIHDIMKLSFSLPLNELIKSLSFMALCLLLSLLFFIKIRGLLLTMNLEDFVWLVNWVKL